jgi:hypothetical protein
MLERQRSSEEVNGSSLENAITGIERLSAPVWLIFLKKPNGRRTMPPKKLPADRLKKPHVLRPGIDARLSSKSLFAN